MLIYRVEHRTDGYGPYADKVALFNHADAEHPTFGEDFEDILESADAYRYFFGFKSKRQLRAWFSKQERVILRENDYVVRVYSVNPKYVHKSEKQLIFMMGYAKALWQIKITERGSLSLICGL